MFTRHMAVNNIKNLKHKVIFSLILLIIVLELAALPLSIAWAITSSTPASSTPASNDISIYNSTSSLVNWPYLNVATTTSIILLEKNINTTTIEKRLPVIPKIKIKQIKTVRITSYTSETAQCDSTPCVTASGFNLCKHSKEDSVALNFLPFGSKIRIPQLFGKRIFIVRDRMNKRYQNRVDVWMKNKKAALSFGIKKAKIEILEK
jgi:3D (Asp-Asp-Asp) domain-containing protein